MPPSAHKTCVVFKPATSGPSPTFLFIEYNMIQLLSVYCTILLQHRSDSFQLKPMYGVPLKSHLQVIGRDIAVPIEECCSVIFYNGISEEGLLRIPGSAGSHLFRNCHYLSMACVLLCLIAFADCDTLSILLYFVKLICSAKIKRVVAALNYPGPVDWNYFGDDLHSIGGAMKQYLRALPEPLLTFPVHLARVGLNFVSYYFICFRF